MVLAHRNNATCQDCPLQSSCRDQALATAKEIHEVMAIGDLLKHFSDVDEFDQNSGGSESRMAARCSQRVMPTPAQQGSLDKMSKKARQVAESLINKGIDVRKQMLNGKNPFVETGQKYLEVTAMLLMEGGFTKKELKQALLYQNPQWTERTAEGQLSVAFSLFTGFGLVTTRQGRFVLKEKHYEN